MTFIVKLMTSQTYLFTEIETGLNKKKLCKQLFDCYLNLHLKFGAILFKNYKDMTLYPQDLNLGCIPYYYSFNCFLFEIVTTNVLNGLREYAGRSASLLASYFIILCSLI